MKIKIKIEMHNLSYTMQYWMKTVEYLWKELVFVKDSILGNRPKYERQRREENRAWSASAEGARVRRRRKASAARLSPEAQEIPRTNSQFLALNSCNAHTSWIRCSFLVCDTD